MGKHRYRKQEPSSIRGTCVRCKKNKQKKKPGGNTFRAICASCDKDLYRSKQGRIKDKETQLDWAQRKYNGYRKEEKCSNCGFVAIHSCQLDVDHIDEDHSNNSLDNLQTLCANCHRLKTWFAHFTDPAPF